MYEISVIVATYNRPEYLRAVVQSLANQKDAPEFEIVVADDGSDRKTADELAALRAQLRVPLIHSWHEDAGFRLAEARNRAVARSTGRALVFLDDDCIARPSLLHRYARFLREGRLVFGERVFFSEQLTASLLTSNEAPGDWSSAWWLARRWARQVDRLSRLVYLPLGPLRRTMRDNWTAAEGCNVGMMRSDFLKVNGYDNRFVGWGCEDWDLSYRLWRAGVEMYDGRFALAVAHLWHREAARDRVSVNQSFLDARRRDGTTRAEDGVDRLIAEGTDRWRSSSHSS